MDDKNQIPDKKSYQRPLAAYGGEKPEYPKWFAQALAVPYIQKKIEFPECTVNYLSWHETISDNVGNAKRQNLIFLHGGRAHAKWWQPICGILAKNHNCISIDLAGMGDSSKADFYSLERYSQHVIEIIEKENLKSPILIGHSFGAAIALNISDIYENLKKIILVDIFIGLLDKENGFNFKFRENPGKMGTNLYKNDKDPIAKFRLLPDQGCKNHFYMDFIAREGLRKVEKDGQEFFAWKYDTTYGDPVEISFRKDIVSNPKKQIDYVFGEKSFFYNQIARNFFKNEIPNNSNLVEIKDAYHHIMLDQPLKFIEEVEKLL